MAPCYNRSEFNTNRATQPNRNPFALLANDECTELCDTETPKYTELQEEDCSGDSDKENIPPYGSFPENDYWGPLDSPTPVPTLSPVPESESGTSEIRISPPNSPFAADSEPSSWQYDTGRISYEEFATFVLDGENRAPLPQALEQRHNPYTTHP